MCLVEVWRKRENRQWETKRIRRWGSGEEGGEGRKMTQHRDKQAASVEGKKKWKEKY